MTAASPRISIPILHRCKDFLIIDKPYDLVINSDDASETTVSTLLRFQFPDLADESIGHQFRYVHRLDYATSGCLLIALNSEAARRGYFAFNPDEIARFQKPLPIVRKYYLALLKGRLEKPKFGRGIVTVDALVGEDRRTPEAVERHQMIALSKQELACDPTSSDWCWRPKPGETKILVLEHGRYTPDAEDAEERKSGYAATKVLVRTLTGRRHQIRTHCLKIGFPIIGDYTYAGDHRAGDENTKDVTEAPPRMYLHAWRLKFSPFGEWNGRRLLDAVSPDSFTKEGTDGRWTPDCVVTPLDDSALDELE